jgi:Flp pilus assembly protein TadG
MMKTHIHRRRGQALVEFSLILPLLILLIFGIIEMARVMQTWVTLQNSARAAARWASIGAIKWDIFDVTYDPVTTPQDQAVLDAIVPCVLTDERGAKSTISGVERYTGGNESLFATWYDGMNCDPRVEDHQLMRRDILRIFSVIHEARAVSNGLGLAAAYNGWDWDNIDSADAPRILYDVWEQPFPGNHEEAGYFYVDVCADRVLLNADSTTVNNLGSRFYSIRNDADRARATSNVAPITPVAGYDPNAPMCMLSEIPPVNNPDGSPNTDRLVNAGLRWWDAGGPGERVVVFIRFNHPWITPINADGGYITLSTRRSSVNESFRAPKAVGAFQRSLPPGRDDNNPARPTSTATNTLEATNTPTITLTPSHTPTATPVPFSCDNVQLVWASVPFTGNAMYVSILNNNMASITLDRVLLEWYASASFPAMYAKAFALDNSTHWQGGVPSTTPQVLVDTSLQGTFYDAAFRTVGGMNAGVWTGIFLNGPANMASAFDITDFEGVFYFTGPSGQNCQIQLIRPNRPTLTPSLTPSLGPSPTRTPDCATAQDITIHFGIPPVSGVGNSTGGFDSFDGSVFFTITNNSAQSTYLLGFDLVWPDATHPQINRAPGDYYLRRATVGGDSVSDPLSQTVWVSSAANEDANGNTRTVLPFDYGTRSNSAEGTWQGNAIIRPGQTRIYFDFDGFPGNLQTAMGVQRHHFNGSLLYIGCSFLYTQTPGGTGNQLQITGVIGVVEPSPTVTNTPGPTSTTGPSHTPTHTRTPTQTFTPSRTPLPSATFTPSNTPGTPSPTPLGQLTPTAGGGGES